jgi:hypothetical protein
MFSVYIAPCSSQGACAGAETWHRRLISTRGFSRRLMFFIGGHSQIYRRNALDIKIIKRIYAIVPQGY